MNQLDGLKQSLREACPGLDLREREPLSKHTMFRIGGPAALMAFPKTGEEAELTLQTAVRCGVTPFFLGLGSNLLVSDEGVHAFVLKLGGGLDALTLESAETLCVGSGVLLAKAAAFAMEHALTGFEFAHGIPGSLGGAVSMNAGAYGGELAQVVTQVTCLDARGRRETVTGEALQFAYRHSAFSDGTRLILGAKLRLLPGNQPEIAERMSALAKQRREKQPLEFPSAGSTFKRPAGRFAGSLIEQCGLKGLQVGGAQVSEKHAGFLINVGGATCADVLALMRLVREAVFRETGVLLEPEVKLLGCCL